MAPPQGADGGTIDPANTRAPLFPCAEGGGIGVGGALLNDALPSAARGVRHRRQPQLHDAAPPRRSRTSLPVGSAPTDAPDRPETIRIRPALSLAPRRTEHEPRGILAPGGPGTLAAAITPPTVHGWPAMQADRLAVRSEEQRREVIKVRTGGNRVLRDGHAVSAPDPFWRDLDAVPAATHLVLPARIYDIGAVGSNGDPLVAATALAARFRQAVAPRQALSPCGLGGTSTPAERALHAGPCEERTRRAGNGATRGNTVLGQVVDLERTVRVPAPRGRLRPGFGPGDHLHRNAADLQATRDKNDLPLQRRRSSGGRSAPRAGDGTHGQPEGPGGRGCCINPANRVDRRPI